MSRTCRHIPEAAHVSSRRCAGRSRLARSAGGGKRTTAVWSQA